MSDTRDCAPLLLACPFHRCVPTVVFTRCQCTKAQDDHVDLRRQIDQIQKQVASVSAAATRLMDLLDVQPMLNSWRPPDATVQSLPEPLYVLHRQMVGAQLFLPDISVRCAAIAGAANTCPDAFYLGTV
jgi:hypothetical protein